MVLYSIYGLSGHAAAGLFGCNRHISRLDRNPQNPRTRCYEIGLPNHSAGKSRPCPQREDHFLTSSLKENLVLLCE